MELKDNMNRMITTMAVMLIVSCMTAQKTQMSVNVKEPGTLADCIGEKNILSVERLTINGQLTPATGTTFKRRPYASNNWISAFVHSPFAKPQLTLLI